MDQYGSDGFDLSALSRAKDPNEIIGILAGLLTPEDLNFLERALRDIVTTIQKKEMPKFHLTITPDMCQFLECVGGLLVYAKLPYEQLLKGPIAPIDVFGKVLSCISLLAGLLPAIGWTLFNNADFGKKFWHVDENGHLVEICPGFKEDNVLMGSNRVTDLHLPFFIKGYVMHFHYGSDIFSQRYFEAYFRSEAEAMFKDVVSTFASEVLSVDSRYSKRVLERIQCLALFDATLFKQFANATHRSVNSVDYVKVFAGIVQLIDEFRQNCTPSKVRSYAGDFDKFVKVWQSSKLTITLSDEQKGSICDKILASLKSAFAKEIIFESEIVNALKGVVGLPTLSITSTVLDFITRHFSGTIIGSKQFCWVDFLTDHRLLLDAYLRVTTVNYYTVETHGIALTENCIEDIMEKFYE